MSSKASTGPRTGELFVVAAPSGAGKSSLINRALAEIDTLRFSVSDTTRTIRRGETDGEHYHFIDRATFDQRVAAGRYLEHAEVFGNGYGTDRARIDAFWNSGFDVLLEIDVQGAEQVRRSHPGACEIFILPPSLATLRARLNKRATDRAEVIERRLAEARNEIASCHEFDWIIVNDDFEAASRQLIAIVRAWPARVERQRRRHENLIAELLA